MSKKIEYVLKKLTEDKLIALKEMVDNCLFFAVDNNELDTLLLYELKLLIEHKLTVERRCDMKLSPSLAYVLYLYLSSYQFTNPYNEHYSRIVVAELDKQRVENRYLKHVF